MADAQSIVSSRPRSRAHPRAQLEIVRPSLDHVLELVLDYFHETPESLRTKNRRPGRKAFAQLAHHECGLTMRMISEYLDISDQAVSRMIRTADQLEQHDREYRRSLASIRNQLS